MPLLKVKENLEAEAELQLQEVEAGKAKLLLEKEKELQAKQWRYFGLAALFYCFNTINKEISSYKHMFKLISGVCVLRSL